MPRLVLALAGKTQAGHRHRVEGLENQDAFFITSRHPLFDAVLMVADGMGGHPRPREAAETAVRTAQQRLAAPDAPLEPAALLRSATRAAHEAVRALADPGAPKPPGTTLSLAVVLDGCLHVAHVGDGSVYLTRDRLLQRIAGGEEQRAGNRPLQYLGQAAPPEPEVRSVPLQPGDRILLCTDGLTRSFREAGVETLRKILGRPGVDVAAIAAQLTAHSRPNEYDDDTTVVVAEVTGMRRGSDRSERPPEAERPRRGRAARVGPAVSGLLGMLLGAGLLALGFMAGRRMAAPPAPVPAGAPAALPTPASRIPENLLLVDPLGGRMLLLAGRPVPLGERPVSFEAWRLGREGRLQPAGRYRLDPARHELVDPDGSAVAVEIDPASGVVRILQSGTLAVRTRAPGARVSIDGRFVGRTPLRIALPAGRHTLLVEGPAAPGRPPLLRSVPIEIAAGTVQSLTFDGAEASGRREP